MADSNHCEPVFIPLADALAQLPLEAPSSSAWPALAAHLANPARPMHSRAMGIQARRTPSTRNALHRWPFAAALAASLLALALLPRGISDHPDAAPASTIGPLMAESARLETLISGGDAVTSSASAVVLSLELEDRLQQIDSQLTAGPHSAAEQHSLWRQRVALLRDYAGFESTRRWYAAEGRSLDVALVAAY